MFISISEPEKHFSEHMLSSMIMNFLPQSSVVSLPQSSIVFNPEMYGPSISLSGLQHLQNICDDYAAEHNMTFNCNKTCGVSFCLKKYKQPASFEYFPQWCMCTVFRPSQVCRLLNVQLKDHNDIHRQVKFQYCAANKLMGTFAQC